MNVLLTSVGRRAYMVKYFKDAVGEDGQVHVCNSDDKTVAFHYADKSVISPLIYDKEYIPFLLEYCKQNRIDILLSLFDIDLPVLAKHKEKFERIGTKVIVSDERVISICNDKWKTYNFLKENGFNVPKTYLRYDDVALALERGEIKYPIVIKPRFGCGSIAMSVAEDKEELIYHVRKITGQINKSYLKYESAAEDEKIIYQMLLCGQEYGADIINDLNGRLQNVVIKKKIAMRAGETDIAELVCQPEIFAEAARLGENLGHIGNMDCDIFLVDGKPYILEMNARFGGGYPFSHMGGCDLPRAILKWASGEVVPPSLLRAKTGAVGYKELSVTQAKEMESDKEKDTTAPISVTLPSMPSYEEYCEEIKSVWYTRHLTNMGPIHNRLREQIKEYLGVENTELFANGHLALYCAIKALGLCGEIITTPFTFASTTNAIIQAGCKPVFCDVKEDYSIDESKIESLITDRTVAILGVHVYGNICNIEAIRKIADKHKLKVIYDAAHAFGVKYKGYGIGSFGDISMFSFHATKVFHTVEGGCLTYSDTSLTDKIAKLRNFGISCDRLECFGTNAKMNEFQAAMGICNLRHIDGEINSRREAFQRYSKRLANVKGLKPLSFAEGVTPNYAYYPILVDREKFGASRDELLKRLQENRIFARKYFYPLTSENKDFDTDMTALTPKAKEYSRNILCLPMYANLDIDEVDKVCDIILS